MAIKAKHARKRIPGIKSISLLRFNLGTFLFFEAIYKLIGALILPALCYGIFYAAVNLSGFRYLAQNNLFDFVKHPLCWIAIALCIFIAGVYAMIEISATVFLCECGRQKRRVGFRSTIAFSARNALRVIHPKNWAAILMMLVVIPLMNIGVAPGIIGAIDIPDFILEFITYHWYLVALLTLAFIALLLLMIRWIFSFAFFTLCKVSYPQACKMSAQMKRGSRLKGFFLLLIDEAGVLIIAVIATILGALAIIILAALAAYATGGVAKSLAYAGVGLLTTFIVLFNVGLVLLTLPICYSQISAHLFNVKESEGRPVERMNLEEYPQETMSRARKAVLGLAIAALSICLALACHEVLEGSMLSKITAEDIGEIMGTHKTEVVAHRCGASYAPENTIAALNKAADMGAPWCELDVQMCKDGTLIIMHDSNFERTTGKDANSWELTYDEVKKLDAGSSYSEKYAGEKIPTLDEMIKAAKKRGMKLQIEVKTTGHDDGIEQDVVDCIVANDFQNDCMIASLDYESLQKAHSYNPEIRTLYLMSLAFGDITAADAATDFSVESTWVSTILVNNAHENDSTIAAWTVNNEKEMKRVISCDVDLIVTDEVEEAIKAAHENSPGYLYEEVISLIAH